MQQFGVLLMQGVEVLVRCQFSLTRARVGQVAVNAQQYTVLVMDVPDFVKQHAKLLQRAERGQWLWRAWCGLLGLLLRPRFAAWLRFAVTESYPCEEQGCQDRAVDCSDEKGRRFPIRRVGLGADQTR